MSRISKISQALIFILLLLVSVYSFCFIQNQTIAYLIPSISFTVIVVFLIFLFVRKKIRHDRNSKIIRETPRVNAQITAVKFDKPGIIILQLLINDPAKEYISSVIVDNTEENRDRYKAGQNINVFVDPKNPDNIVFPEKDKVFIQRKKTNNWLMFIYIPIIAGSFLTPFIIGIFDHSDRLFNDLAFIKANGQQENIWELRYKSPDKIFINIYDPITNKKVKSIKDKKKQELESYTSFRICRQNQKVYIIGIGTSPVIDIYDAVSFEKISDIKKFEESNSIFSKGISQIQSKSVYSQFVFNDIYEITTNDGNKCCYQIHDDKFFYTDKELEDYIQKSAYDLVRLQMFLFTLSAIPNAVDKHQLYIVKITDTSAVKTLQNVASTNSLNIDYFNENKNNYYKDCQLVPLCPDEYFLEGRIIYFDASMVIIQHATAINKDAEVLLSGIDKKGKTLFTVKQSDYPNIKEMIEDNYYIRDSQKINVVRSGNNIVFLFGNYGGLCVDITNGTILWKFEL